MCVLQIVIIYKNDLCHSRVRTRVRDAYKSCGSIASVVIMIYNSRVHQNNVGYRTLSAIIIFKHHLKTSYRAEKYRTYYVY